MKRFLLKILLFAAILTTLTFVLPILCIAPQYLGHYTATLNTKVNRLKAVDAQKIILIGNSNLIYGIDSELLEHLTGMPVVNLGFHGGMGNAFHERMARLHTNAGDLVIISHLTYADDDQIENTSLIWPTLENHFQLWPLLHAQDIMPAVDAYPKYLRDILRFWITGTGNQQNTEGLFRSDAFNAYGDIYVHRTHLVLGWTPTLPMPEINDTCTNRINALNCYVTERGATLLIAGFPVYYQNEPDAAEKLAEFTAALQEQLDCPVISDFSDYLYPTELFFDTEFHLTTEGAKIRTQQLANDIVRWRAKQGEDVTPS